MFKTKVSDRISSNGSTMGRTKSRVQQQTLQVPTRTAHLEKMPEKNEAKVKADVSNPFEGEDQSNFQGLLTSTMILSGINVKLDLITAIPFLSLLNAKFLSYQDLNQELEEIMESESISYQDLDEIMKVPIDLKEIMDATIDWEEIMEASIDWEEMMDASIDLKEIMEFATAPLFAALNTTVTDDKTPSAPGGIADKNDQVAEKQATVRDNGPVTRLPEHEASEEGSRQEVQDGLVSIPAIIEKFRVGEVPYTGDLITQLALFDACLKVQEISRKRERDEEILVIKRRKLRIAESRLALEKQIYKIQQKHTDLLQQTCSQRGDHTLADTDDSEDESGSD